MTVRCRELVIGSGPGGAITAGLLAEAGRDVLVVEEGPDDANPPLPYSLDEVVRRYRNRGLNPAFGKPKIAFVEGCCLGGGSEINSALYHRTPPEILDHWQRTYGVVEAGVEDLLPHFEAVERSISVCRSPGPMPAPSRKLQQGAGALGWKCIELPRWVEYNGSRHPDGSPMAVRMTMSRTWIPRARSAGARFLVPAKVTELARSGGVWQATARSAGKTVTIRADHVFLCCGAVQTPLLLRRMGIRANAGNSLAMHPTIKVVARFDDEVNYEGLGVPFHQIKEFAPRVTFGSSISSPPHLALAMLDHPESAARVLEGWRNAAVFYVAVTGPPTGRVRQVPFSNDPFIRYQPTAADLRDLATGMKNLCRLLLEAGAVELFPSLTPGRTLRVLDDLRRWPESVPPSRTNLMTIHLFCSCPMGENRERSAVDSWGRVWEAPHLSIHDASIFCDAPSVNPQGSVMAFAHRNTARYLTTAARS